jgi:murein DD-endopeptidase MepM/ murein hydrolase activator NlpD
MSSLELTARRKMATLLWPLERNRIRRDAKNHTFGMVRTKDGKPRPHQGWDLVATPGTACYAVAYGVVGPIKSYERRTGYGKQVILKIAHRGRTLYAFYGHLSSVLVRETQTVKAGTLLGYTGNTGNAFNMEGEDQHLHFEFRTREDVGTGLDGRIDPKEVYGILPSGYFIDETHGAKLLHASLGARPGGGHGLYITAAQMRRWPSGL